MRESSRTATESHRARPVGVAVASMVVIWFGVAGLAFALIPFGLPHSRALPMAVGVTLVASGVGMLMGVNWARLLFCVLAAGAVVAEIVLVRRMDIGAMLLVAGLCAVSTTKASQYFGGSLFAVRRAIDGRQLLVSLGRWEAIAAALGFLTLIASSTGLWLQRASAEIWEIEFPAQPDDPEAVQRVRSTLERRAAALSWIFGADQVHYSGLGHFLVALDSRDLDRAFVDRVLTDPGYFSLRASAASDCSPIIVESAIVSPAAVESAAVIYTADGQPNLGVQLSAPAGAYLKEYTHANEGNLLNACLDGRLLKSFVIGEEIGSRFVISNFDLDEARAIAAILKGGTLAPGGRVLPRD